MKLSFIALLILISFFIGVLFGKNTFKTKETVKQLSINSTQDISNKESSIQEQNTKKTKIYFKDGRIDKKIVYEVEHKKQNIVENNVKLEEHKEITEIVKITNIDNWLLGVQSPIKLNPKFDEITIQIGYRVIGSTYLTLSSDAHLKTSLGVTFSF